MLWEQNKILNLESEQCVLDFCVARTLPPDGERHDPDCPKWTRDHRLDLLAVVGREDIVDDERAHVQQSPDHLRNRQAVPSEVFKFVLRFSTRHFVVQLFFRLL